MLFRMLLALFIVFSSSVICRADMNVKSEYTFGIVPQQSAHDLVRLWTPLLRYLSHKSNIHLSFETAPNITEFEQRLARGEYDFAYMNPYHYTIFHEHPGYLAFAHQENKRLTGLIVTRVDSQLNLLEELEGKDIAFPAPAAFAATVIPRAMLIKKGIQHTPLYVRSHDSVYRNVAQGFVLAGGGIERTLEALEPELRDQLRVIWRSKGYAPHAFSVHPRVSESIVADIQKVLIDLKNSDEGADLLSHINFDGIEAAENKDWDNIRAMNIKLLQYETQHED